MAKRDSNGAMRRRLSRLRKTFKTLDYRASDRNIRFKEINNTIDLLLCDLPRVTGGHATSAEQTKQDGFKLIQEIKDKLEEYRKIPAEKRNKIVTRSHKVDSYIPPRVEHDDQLSSKEKRLESPNPESQGDTGRKDKKAKISHREDDDDCVITKVVRRSSRGYEQEAIEVEMAQRDESLWYDPSEDFDEDMLP